MNATAETLTAPKYPDIVAVLLDGNAFSIVAACRRAAKDARLPKSEIEAFTDEAMRGDYDHVIVTAIKWFSIELV